MSKNKKNIDIDPNSGLKPDGFFQHVEVPRNKPREAVWADLNKKLMDKPKPKVFFLKSKKLIYSVAASLILLAGIYAFIRLYTSTVTCPEGKHLSYVLPDGSKIEMNVDSKIVYRPLWWRFERKLKFEGEAYFQVEKGKKFEVISEKGTTEVAGTAFNIYARDNDYKVTCIDGRVKVTSFKSKVTYLSPKHEATVTADGVLMVQRDEEAEDNIAWVKNMFSFTAKPLSEVFNEIARQYGIKITVKDGGDYLYTGYFSKDKPAEEVLTVVCRPFGLSFTRGADKSFEIFQN